MRFFLIESCYLSRVFFACERNLSKTSRLLRQAATGNLTHLNTTPTHLNFKLSAIGGHLRGRGQSVIGCPYLL